MPTWIERLPVSKHIIVESVFEQVRNAAPPGMATSLTIDTELSDAGLDSLARMDVVNGIEQQFKIRFDEESLYDLETIQDLVELIEFQLDPQAESAVPASAAAAVNSAVTVDVNGDTPSIAKNIAKPAAIATESNDVSLFPEIVQFANRVAGMESAGVQLPFFRANESVQGSSSTIAGRNVVSFTSFDYLGMAQDDQVTMASKEAIDRFGTSASASRLVGGNNTLLEDLDTELARFLGTEAASVFPSGYGTNASLFGHLFNEEDLILYDDLAHNSIVQGAKMSTAKRRAFPHNDAKFLDDLLSDIRGNYRRVVVAIEGVYSMDGDFPNLPHFIEVKKRHQALLYVDEAHSLGVMGPTGRGICEHFGVSANEGDLWMGTISKALGSCGGYIAGRRALIDYLKYTTPSMVFSTAAPPASAAAALTAIRVLLKEPERVSRVREQASLFLKLADDSGLNTGNSDLTPIVPVILGNSRMCLWMSQELLKHGINAQPILYPAVPENASRLRFFLTAAHTDEDICRTVQCVSDLVQAGRQHFPEAV
jgi:8-amino-7-oxononanoate synthase